jgi:hypothetical protein
LDKAEEIVGVVLPTNEDPATRRTIRLNYFQRSPESEVWVVFRDLPAPTRDRLRARIAAGDAPADDGWLGWAGDALSQEAMATTDITTNNITVAATPGATSKRGSTPHSRLGTRKNGQRINLQELQARPAFYLLGLLQEGRTRSQDQEKRKPSKCPP